MRATMNESVKRYVRRECVEQTTGLWREETIDMVRLLRLYNSPHQHVGVL
jgi:hypothetical protein